MKSRQRLVRHLQWHRMLQVCGPRQSIRGFAAGETLEASSVTSRIFGVLVLALRPSANLTPPKRSRRKSHMPYSCASSKMVVHQPGTSATCDSVLKTTITESTFRGLVLGQGVYPSVKTTTMWGHGRAATAALIPAPMSVPPPPRNSMRSTSPRVLNDCAG